MAAKRHKKIFLTGGTGFFGKSLLSMLKRGFAPEYEFTILSRDPKGFLAAHPEFSSLPQLRFIAGDVRDFAFPAGRFDAVLHAATPAVTTLPPGEMRSIILRGTERVLSFARICGAEKLLLTSSGAVYGPQPPEWEAIPEDLPCSPVTEYGIAKLEAEQMCAASGIFTLLPRCFAFTGPWIDRNIHYAIGNFLRDALTEKPIIIKGDGTPLRSYLFADDLIRWLFTILECGQNAVPCNVGSDQAISIAALAERVKKVLHSASKIEICGAPSLRQERYIPDISRAKSWGCRITFSLDQAISASLSPFEQTIVKELKHA